MQSPMFVKTEEFMVWLLGHTAKFPKSERFRLAQRIDNAIFDFHAVLIAAATYPNQAREYLLQAQLELNKLRAYLRLAMETRCASQSQYGFAAEYTVELGKLLGGWLKSLKTA
jgi:hypothetical protein